MIKRSWMFKFSSIWFQQFLNVHVWRFEIAEFNDKVIFGKFCILEKTQYPVYSNLKKISQFVFHFNLKIILNIKCSHIFGQQLYNRYFPQVLGIHQIQLLLET